MYLATVIYHQFIIVYLDSLSAVHHLQSKDLVCPAFIMVHTVGITGVNGNVGAAALPGLVKAAREENIKLIIFHREGSSVTGASQEKNIELRVLQFEDPAEKIEQAIKGVNVFM